MTVQKDQEGFSYYSIKGLAMELPGVSLGPRTHLLKATGAFPLISVGSSLLHHYLLQCPHKLVETFTLILLDTVSPGLV